MSLFIGNVSKHVSHKELQSLFKKYGKCKIDLRDRYAFVQFQNDNHAEAAKKQLQHETFHGLQLNIEWSKNSGRFGQNNKRKDRGAQRKRSRSRENRWRRDDQWGRRSPSNERSSPSYSGNKDMQTFVAVCPRDEIILKKLMSNKIKQQSKHRQSSKKEIASVANGNFVSGTQIEVEQNHPEGRESKGQNRLAIQSAANNNIEEEEGIIHEDGEIPTNQ